MLSVDVSHDFQAIYRSFNDILSLMDCSFASTWHLRQPMPPSHRPRLSPHSWGCARDKVLGRARRSHAPNRPKPQEKPSRKSTSKPRNHGFQCSFQWFFNGFQWLSKGFPFKSASMLAQCRRSTFCLSACLALDDMAPVHLSSDLMPRRP